MVDGSPRFQNCPAFWLMAIRGSKPSPTRKHSRCVRWLSDWKTARPYRKSPSFLRLRHERVAGHAGAARPSGTPADRVDDQTPVGFTPNPVAGRLVRFCFCVPRSRRDRSTNARPNLQADRPHPARPLISFRPSPDASTTNETRQMARESKRAHGTRNCPGTRPLPFWFDDCT